VSGRRSLNTLAVNERGWCHFTGRARAPTDCTNSCTFHATTAIQLACLNHFGGQVADKYSLVELCEVIDCFIQTISAD